MSTHKSLAKSAGIIGLGILLSRILGFVRDIIIASVFGTLLPAQAFVVALRIPNLLRDLVGEGAANAAFIPVLTEYATKKTKREFWELAGIILNAMIVVLAAISILGVILAPFIVRVIAPGFVKDADKLQLTVRLTQVMFPYIFLIGLTAYATGVLNSLKHFTAPAFSQPLWNIALILSALYLCPKMQVPVMGLAIGVLIGGLLQLSVQALPLFNRGMAPPKLNKFKHPASTEIGKLLLPRVLGASIYQINTFVDMMLASLSRIVGEGAIAALYYSNRLWQFPLAIFGTAWAQATLPTLSEHAAEEDIKRFKDTLSFSLRSVFFITIPAAIGLLVLSTPIVQALFERGSFNRYSTEITSYALFYYSLGLFAYAGVKILVSAFYSLKDTLTPVKVALAALILNIILNLILMWPLKVGGLALATSISSTVNFFLLYYLLRKKIGPLGGFVILKSVGRILLAGVIMGLILIWVNSLLVLAPIPQVAIVIFVGLVSFFVGCMIFDVDEFKGFLRWILRRS
ncbi:MAG: murein biosynthesis integral membrane protein MurJ [Candidatus Omnitrophota bacterium]